MIAPVASTDRDALVLVDPDDVELGTAPKLDVHRDGRLHRAVSVMVFDDAGRVLLQRRAPGKYHSAGLWSNTACGHPLPGERVLDAARRRLRAEMGIEPAELTVVSRFVYRALLDDGLVEHELDHVVVGRWTGEPRPDASEVAAWGWMTPSDLAHAIGAMPERFTAWLPHVLRHALAQTSEGATQP